jgi:hypothetical protein
MLVENENNGDNNEDEDESETSMEDSYQLSTCETLVFPNLIALRYHHNPQERQV